MRLQAAPSRGCTGPISLAIAGREASALRRTEECTAEWVGLRCRRSDEIEASQAGVASHLRAHANIESRLIAGSREASPVGCLCVGVRGQWRRLSRGGLLPQAALKAFVAERVVNAAG